MAQANTTDEFRSSLPSVILKAVEDKKLRKITFGEKNITFADEE